MFNFFSNIIFSLIIPGLGVGMLLLIVSIYIPNTLATYKIPLQISGVVILVFFLFQAGRYSEVKKNELIRLQNIALIAELKVKSEKVNTETITRFVDRIKVVEKIKEVKTNVYITKEADAACVIDPITSSRAARLLNDSVAGRVPRTTDSVDGSTK